LLCKAPAVRTTSERDLTALIDAISQALAQLDGDLAVAVFGSVLTSATPHDVDVWLDGNTDVVAMARDALASIDYPLHVSSSVEAAGFSHELLDALRWEVRRRGVTIRGHVPPPDRRMTDEIAGRASGSYFRSLADAAAREAAVLARIEHSGSASFASEALRQWMMATATDSAGRSLAHRSSEKVLLTTLAQTDPVLAQLARDHGVGSAVFVDALRDRINA
jgi:hypothetical protein